MVAVHRLSADIYEDYFDLIALQSHLKDYALAYALNRYLKTGFVRRRKDLDISEPISIPIFEWKDDAKEQYWTFFANRRRWEGKSEQNGLFEKEALFHIFYMVPEYRNADYLIKIEQEGFESQRRAENGRLVKRLQDIPKISMAYSIDTEQLKLKNNLIF